jgi:penicillin-binding protein 1A
MNLQNAFIATEDNDFFDHWGISTKGILRAAVTNFLKRKVAQGGSTITQQLSKTIFLTSEKTILRKFKELLLTVQLERNYTKEEILQLYINQIYFGAGGYGAESASKIYFGKSVRDLNLAESALIAGLPKAPNYYSPFKSIERAKQRRAVVLSRMRDLNFITKEQEEEANNYPIPDRKNLQEQTAGYYFIEYLRILLEPKYGTNVLHKGGLSIYTTLDIKMQRAAEKALAENLNNFDTQMAGNKSAANKKVQGAIMAIDPKTGAIRVMVGGRDFKETQFNRAVQAKRQAGSAFKPFVYTAAIDSKLMTPATLLNDEQMVFAFDGRNWNLVSSDLSYVEILAEKMTEDELIDPMKIWYPANYDGNKYRGIMPLMRSRRKSVNTCAIEVIDKVGLRKSKDYARRMGIKSPL